VIIPLPRIRHARSQLLCNLRDRRDYLYADRRATKTRERQLNGCQTTCRHRWSMGRLVSTTAAARPFSPQLVSQTSESCTSAAAIWHNITRKQHRWRVYRCGKGLRTISVGISLPYCQSRWSHSGSTAGVSAAGSPLQRVTTARGCFGYAPRCPHSKWRHRRTPAARAASAAPHEPDGERCCRSLRRCGCAMYVGVAGAQL